jgi:hypothetical protein
MADENTKTLNDLLKSISSAVPAITGRKSCGCMVGYLCNHTQKKSCGCDEDIPCMCVTPEMEDAFQKWIEADLPKPDAPTVTNRVDAVEGEEWAVVIRAVSKKVAITRVKVGTETKVGGLDIVQRFGHNKEAANKFRNEYLVIEEIMSS